MLIATFFNWRTGTSGLSTDSLGLLGILTLLFGAAIAAVAAIRAFAPQVSLPTDVLGISLDKISVMLSATVFLWTFGMISGNGIKFGLHLTWIAAAVATVGGVLTMRDSSAPARG